MADRRALKGIGLSFGALTVTVTLIAAAVVKQHTDSQPTLDPSRITSSRGEQLDSLKRVEPAG